MTICTIHATTTISVPDHRNLLATWRAYRNPLCASLLGSLHVEKPLTEAQLRRLPRELRARLVA